MSCKHVEELASAKINLFLHITGKREDGYHLVDSLMCFTEFGDRIRVEPSQDLSLQIQGPFARTLQEQDKEDNLVARAARLLAKAYDIPAHAAICIEKNLPVASGIGGGSADAAATLRALTKCWDIPSDNRKLQDLALGLGADTPPCLRNTTLRAKGIGEKLTTIEAFPRLDLVLVNPGIAVSTPTVFQARTGPFQHPDFVMPERLSSTDKVVGFLKQTQNGLGTAAQTLFPQITTVLETLDNQPGCRLSRLSGSGATCWAIFEDAQTAATAAANISQKHKNWWCVATRTR